MRLRWLNLMQRLIAAANPADAAHLQQDRTVTGPYNLWLCRSLLI
jgi:hypothetical protein